MGGGGLVIADAFAVCAMGMARWVQDPVRRHQSKSLKKETGYAHFVMPKIPRAND